MSGPPVGPRGRSSSPPCRAILGRAVRLVGRVRSSVGQAVGVRRETAFQQSSSRVVALSSFVRSWVGLGSVRRGSPGALILAPHIGSLDCWARQRPALRSHKFKSCSLRGVPVDVWRLALGGRLGTLAGSFGLWPAFRYVGGSNRSGDSLCYTGPCLARPGGRLPGLLRPFAARRRPLARLVGLLVAGQVVLTGCAAPQADLVRGDFTARPPAAPFTPPLGDAAMKPVTGGDKSVDVQVGAPVDGASFQPFRLVFTAVTADTVMRRLSDWVGVRWISDDGPLVGATLSMDVQVSTWEDVYSVVARVAESASSAVRWRGSTAVFSQKKEGQVSPADGYLIRTAPISEQLAAIAKERFGVSCAPYQQISVCLGSVLDIEDARRFFAALEGAYGRVEWRVIETTVPVGELVKSLGLTQQVVASEVGQQRWLVASADERLLLLVVDAVNAAGGPQCSLQTYRPEHVAVAELMPLLNGGLVKVCDKPVASNGAIYWTATPDQAARARAVLVHADHDQPLARFLVIVAEETDAARLGVTGDFQVGTVNTAENVQLLVSLARTAGWRTVELTTSGKGSAAVTQTDRVQGQLVLTTGGSQVQGIDNRTVGLTINVDGDVTAEGFRGKIDLRDSALNGETEVGSSCQGSISVTFSSVARVCSYQRNDGARGLSTTAGLDLRRARQNFVVVAALLAHEQAPIDTLRIVLQGKR